MKNAFILILSIIVSILFAQTNYVVLNSLGETLSIGNWIYSLDNDLITVGSMPNQIISDVGGETDCFWVVASGDNEIQSIWLIDGIGVMPADTYSLPVGSNPYLMYIDGVVIYTTLWVSGAVATINLYGGDMETSPHFCLSPQGIYADSGYIYVSDGNLDPISFEYGQGILWKLNMDYDVIDSMIIGTNPQQIAEDSDGNLHIICTGDYMDVEGSVYIIDKSSFSVIDSVKIGGTPQRIVLDNEAGVAYSVTSLFDDWVGVPGSGRLLAYDIATRDIIWDANDTVNKLQGTGLIGFAISGDYALIPSMDSSFIEIVEIIDDGIVTINKLTTGYGPLDVDVFDPTGIVETPAKPDYIAISAYPNPFNSAVTITAPAGAEIETYDVNGRLLDVIPDYDRESSGAEENLDFRLYGNDRTVVWQPSKNITSGIYLVRAKIDDQTTSNKIIYLK